MREKEVQQPQSTETRDETDAKGEPKEPAPKKRATDTLTDDNPLICRGMD